MATQGYTVPEGGASLRARPDLCEQAGEAPQVFRALIGQYTFHLARAEHERVGELVQDLLRLARGTGDAAHLHVGPHGHGGDGLLARGALRRPGSIWRKRSLATTRRSSEAADSSSIRADPGVWALIYLAWTLWQLGYPEQALTRSQESLALARELSHAFS